MVGDGGGKLCARASFKLDKKKGQGLTVLAVGTKYRWGLLRHFSLPYHIVFISPSLWKTARCRLTEHCLNEPLNPQQPTRQYFLSLFPQNCELI